MGKALLSNTAIMGFNRFGLGARLGGADGVGGGIRDALRAEIAAGPAEIAPSLKVVSSVEAYGLLRAEREQIKAQRLALAGKTEIAGPPGGMSAAKEVALAEKEAPGEQKFKRQVVRELFQAEAAARLEAALAARVGYAERLVHFWSNHFCISVRKAGVVRVLAGAYEREVVRPHVFGRFADMLLAAEKHPAMLIYLDNEQSIGPNSRGGQRQQKGLNENLAREIMELHTLGAGGGYSQADVTSLSRILTGWRFARQDNPQASQGHFFFNPNLHEPGDHKLMGVVYGEDGEPQGERALLALAHHPSTARHIARKLAFHFVSDTPSQALIARLENAFAGTGGDLAAVSLCLIEAPEAWEGPAAKMRLPYEFAAAAMRATGVAMEAPLANRALLSLGQPLWSPPGPNGFSDQSAAWISPEGIKARLDFSARIAEAVPGDASPAAILDEVLGDAASEHTRVAIARAESRSQGFALLLMSPEFQRR